MEEKGAEWIKVRNPRREEKERRNMEDKRKERE